MVSCSLGPSQPEPVSVRLYFHLPELLYTCFGCTAAVQQQARSYIAAKAGKAFYAGCQLVSYLRPLDEGFHKGLFKYISGAHFLLFAYPVSDGSLYYFTLVLDNKGHLKKLLKIPDQQYQSIDRPIDSSKAALGSLADKLKKTDVIYKNATLKYDTHTRTLVWMLEFEGK